MDIPADFKASQLLDAVKRAEPGVDIRCRHERQYAILKIALLKLQRDDISLLLLDSAGRLVRQVSARKRSDGNETQEGDGLSRSQLAAIAALEKAFRQCKAEKLQFVGFSDSLVAVPEHLGCGAEAVNSPEALELDTRDAYHGYDDEWES